MKKHTIVAVLGAMVCLASIQANPIAQMPAMANCNSLTASEQQFASGLKASNQMMFCSKMNQDQRNTVMQMVGQPDATGNMMTPDGAVEKVAKDNNMVPMVQKNGGSSCPAK